MQTQNATPASITPATPATPVTPVQVATPAPVSKFGAGKCSICGKTLLGSNATGATGKVCLQHATMHCNYVPAPVNPKNNPTYVAIAQICNITQFGNLAGTGKILPHGTRATPVTASGGNGGYNPVMQIVYNPVPNGKTPANFICQIYAIWQGKAVHKYFLAGATPAFLALIAGKATLQPIAK
jgi:hypothetical protein